MSSSIENQMPHSHESNASHAQVSKTVHTPQKKMSSWLITVIVIVAVGAIGALYSWYQKVASPLIIDNPTAASITVVVNEETYTVPAGEYVKASLPFGEWTYTVSLNGQEVWSFQKQSTDGKAILNPTMSMYIEERQLYGDEQAETIALTKGDIENTTVCIDGKNYEWYNLKAYTGLYFAQERDYGIDEESPESTAVPVGASYATKDELFRKQQILTIYEDVWEEMFSDC